MAAGHTLLSEMNTDKQALTNIFQFLKHQNLKETEEALKKELGIHVTTVSAVPTSSSCSQPEEVEDSYLKLLDFVDKSLDMYRHEQAILLYPVFVHLYLMLVLGGHTEYAVRFFKEYHNKQESYYQDELVLLKSLTTVEQAQKNDLVDMYMKNKFTTRMSQDSLQYLLKHLQVNHHRDILRVIEHHVHIDVYDGLPRSHLDISRTMGSMTGEALLKVNKSKVYYGIPRDPDVTAALAELEKEEADAAGTVDDDKPKKKKTKKESGGAGKKAKTTSSPNAPPLNRVPLPSLRDSEKAAKFQAYKDAAKCVSLGPSALPSVCFYTLLNITHGVNTVEISQDSVLLAAGFSNSIIRLWTLTSKKLCPLKPATQMPVSLAAEDILERIIDTSSSSEVRVLTGHSGPVYSLSFNNDSTFLLSSSEDGTVRLWSLQTYTTLVSFKGHVYPVWGVEFSPLGYYFASCSHDRTARLWSTEQVTPLRIFAGHSSDVECCRFHPNGNYIATGSSDRSVRMWDIVTGHCVRIFTGHKGSVCCLAFSYDGKYLASSGADKQIFVWDIDTATQLRDFTGHTNSVYQLEFSRDNSLLASGGLDNSVKLWDLSRLEEERDRLSHECLLGSYPTKSTPIQCLHFSRKNLLLAAGPFTG